MAEQRQTERVNTHYTRENLADTFARVLRSWGKEDATLTADDLAPLDQFHVGGKAATLALAALAGIGPATRVLDVGGGFGGPARTLAASYGCPVTVLDLTEVYCQIGEMLTARSGLSDRVVFRHADALAIPYPDAAFDLVWTQHSSMNIADKRRLYAEIHRVLRPCGHLALYEIMAGMQTPLHYPVPWAGDASISFLSPPDEVHDLLTDLGYRTVYIGRTSRMPPSRRRNRSPRLWSRRRGCISSLARISSNGRAIWDGISPSIGQH